MAAYDEAAFNEQLNENMADDPYGTAMYLITEALKGALSLAGGMSGDEYQTLLDIAVKLDPEKFGELTGGGGS